MEYAIVGSVLSLLISMKFTDYKTKETEERIKALEANVELVTTAVQTSEAEAPKKTLMIVAPVAKAVKDLQTAIGVQWSWPRYSSITESRIKLQQLICLKMRYQQNCLIGMQIGLSVSSQSQQQKNHL